MTLQILRFLLLDGRHNTMWYTFSTHPFVGRWNIEKVNKTLSQFEEIQNNFYYDALSRKINSYAIRYRANAPATSIQNVYFLFDNKAQSRLKLSKLTSVSATPSEIQTMIIQFLLLSQFNQNKESFKCFSTKEEKQILRCNLF